MLRESAGARERYFRQGDTNHSGEWDIKGVGQWEGLALASSRPICALGQHEKINNRKEGGDTWGFS